MGGPRPFPLTTQGYDLIDQAVAAHVETQAKLVSVLSEEQRKQLDDLLSQFLRGLAGD
ncbi:hypothetical protein [Halopseudomonas salegens]|uniref:hypothetical protein n=1 Tax=Halopseudomonas salegens TaxID=1434072 RepID=UPI0018D3EC2B|nr:hypothetical protein [Halopseudomonas salegens]